jgi:sigma-B regulation protein RsbU (phosphoserine phosphatase)
LESGNFVTAVYGVLDFKNHVFTFANCGHNLPIILRGDDSVECLQEGGPVLGVSAAAVYEERPTMLAAGDICVLYTDGVTEVFDAKGEEYGMDRLIDVVKAHKSKSAKEIMDAVLDAARSFAAPGHTFDDLTMIVFKRTAE